MDCLWPTSSPGSGICEQGFGTRLEGKTYLGEGGGGRMWRKNDNWARVLGHILYKVPEEYEPNTLNP